MMIKGGLFEKVRDEQLIAEMCGVIKHVIDGETYVTFKVIDPGDPKTGLIRYSRYNLVERKQLLQETGGVAFAFAGSSEGGVARIQGGEDGAQGGRLHSPRLYSSVHMANILLLPECQGCAHSMSRK